MDVVDNIRTEMNNGWELFPEWVKEIFLPIKEVVVLLLDEEKEELARDTVAIQQCPAGETIERHNEFNLCKQSVINGINNIISYKEANDITKTPEFIEEIRRIYESRIS